MKEESKPTSIILIVNSEIINPTSEYTTMESSIMDGFLTIRVIKTTRLEATKDIENIKIIGSKGFGTDVSKINIPR